MDEGRVVPLLASRTIKGLVSWGARNGVYYFLGNVPSHINHALPLYKVIGGTFIVLSRDAFEYCKRQGVDVVCIDDDSSLFLEFSPDEVGRTVCYLNTHARVVIYYEIYPIAEHLKAKQIMLTHGNSFKDYYIEWRQRYMPYYDLFAGLGPIWKLATEKAGVPSEKIIEVGLARSDEIIKGRRKQWATRRKVASKLGVSKWLKVVSYMPTWWGPTSVNELGKSILRCMPEDYLVIFRPHPSTPQAVIDEYVNLIEEERLNTFYLPEGNEWNLSLNDILISTDVLIGDMSSVVLEALLADIPILIAYGDGDRRQDVKLYDPVMPALRAYASIDMGNVGRVGNMVADAIRLGVNKDVYGESKDAVFYGLEGDNVDKIKTAIRRLMA